MEVLAMGAVVGAVCTQAVLLLGYALFAPEKLEKFSVSEHIKKHFFNKED